MEDQESTTQDTSTPLPGGILDYVQPVAAPAGASRTGGCGPDPAPAPARTGGDESGMGWLRKHKVAAIAIAVVIVLIIVIIAYLVSERSLARKLEIRGWTVYLKDGCGWCHKQIGLIGGFGRAIHCSKTGEIIGGFTRKPAKSLADIKGFPFWHNTLTGEERTGFQDASALDKMAHA